MSAAWTTTRVSRRARRDLRAVVVGGGFIGIETAENLVGLGFEVTLLQTRRPDHGAARIEMARYVERHLDKHGVRVVLNAAGSGFRKAAAARSRS